MQIKNGLCKLCNKEEMLFYDSRITQDIRTAFFPSRKANSDIEKLYTCPSCAYKVQLSCTVKKSYGKELRRKKKDHKHCMLCGTIENILLETGDNPCDFRNCLNKLAKSSNGVNFEKSFVCLRCLYGINVWTEMQSNIYSVLGINDQDDNSSTTSSSEVLFVSSFTQQSHGTQKYRGIRGQMTPSPSTDSSDQFVPKTQTKNLRSSRRIAKSITTKRTRFAVLKRTPKKGSKSNTRTYLKNCLKRILPVNKLKEVNFDDVIKSDRKMYFSIPYIKMGAKLPSIEIISSDEEQKAPVFKLSRIVGLPQDYNINEHLCHICDKSFTNRCSYLSHSLKHQKMEDLVIDIKRLHIKEDGTLKNKEKLSLIPQETINRLLTKYLGGNNESQPNIQTETLNASPASQHKRKGFQFKINLSAKKRKYSNKTLVEEESVTKTSLNVEEENVDEETNRDKEEYETIEEHKEIDDISPVVSPLHIDEHSDREDADVASVQTSNKQNEEPDKQNGLLEQTQGCLSPEMPQDQDINQTKESNSAYSTVESDVSLNSTIQLSQGQSTQTDPISEKLEKEQSDLPANKTDISSEDTRELSQCDISSQPEDLSPAESVVMFIEADNVNIEEIDEQPNLDSLRIESETVSSQMSSGGLATEENIENETLETENRTQDNSTEENPTEENSEDISETQTSQSEECELISDVVEKVDDGIGDTEDVVSVDEASQISERGKSPVLTKLKRRRMTTLLERRNTLSDEDDDVEILNDAVESAPTTEVTKCAETILLSDEEKITHEEVENDVRDMAVSKSVLNQTEEMSDKTDKDNENTVLSEASTKSDTLSHSEKPVQSSRSYISSNETADEEEIHEEDENGVRKTSVSEIVFNKTVEKPDKTMEDNEETVLFEASEKSVTTLSHFEEPEQSSRSHISSNITSDEEVVILQGTDQKGDSNSSHSEETTTSEEAAMKQVEMLGETIVWSTGSESENYEADTDSPIISSDDVGEENTKILRKNVPIMTNEDLLNILVQDSNGDDEEAVSGKRKRNDSTSNNTSINKIKRVRFEEDKGSVSN